MNPIQYSIVRTVEGRSTTRQGPVERVEYVRAIITRNHYRPNQRVDFPKSGITSIPYMRDNLNSIPGDDRGHIVGSIFGGPPVGYNMFPQHRSVNRNLQQDHIVLDWRETERAMQDYLSKDKGYIQWDVALEYSNATTGRPHAIIFRALFYDHDGVKRNELSGHIRNFKKDF